MGGSTGATVGARGAESDFRSSDRLLRLSQLALQGFQLGPERRASLVGNLGQVRIEWRTGSRPPVGLESTANGVDLSYQLNVELTRTRRFWLAHGKAPRRGRGQGRRDKTLAKRICLFGLKLCQFSYRSSHRAATTRGHRCDATRLAAQPALEDSVRQVDAHGRGESAARMRRIRAS